MTSFAGMQGMAVLPMWSNRMARSPNTPPTEAISSIALCSQSDSWGITTSGGESIALSSTGSCAPGSPSIRRCLSVPTSSDKTVSALRRPRRPLRPSTRSLLTCGMAAGPLFVAVYTASGRLRAGYDPRRLPVSALALGDTGWVQTANFWTTGVLTGCAALGIHRALGHRPVAGAGVSSRTGAASPVAGSRTAAPTLVPLLIAAAGCGLIGAAIFPTDPISDPPALDAGSLSRTGALHVTSAVPVFIGLPAACLITARWMPLSARGRAASVVAGVLSLAAATQAGKGFAGDTRLSNWAGLYQRLALLAGLGWLAAFSHHLR